MNTYYCNFDGQYFETSALTIGKARCNILWKIKQSYPKLKYTDFKQHVIRSTKERTKEQKDKEEAFLQQQSLW